MHLTQAPPKPPPPICVTVWSLDWWLSLGSAVEPVTERIRSRRSVACLNEPKRNQEIAATTAATTAMVGDTRVSALARRVAASLAKLFRVSAGVSEVGPARTRRADRPGGRRPSRGCACAAVPPVSFSLVEDARLERFRVECVQLRVGDVARQLYAIVIDPQRSPMNVTTQRRDGPG
jgi:hypothetical protein